MPDGGINTCDSDSPLKEKPYFCSDRASLGFNREFQSGTFIGASTRNSLTIENRGLATLTLGTPVLSGPDAAAFTFQGPTKPMLKGKERTAFEFLFTPTQARIYNATFTIPHNGENAVNGGAEISLSGRGVSPDGGS